MEKIYNNRIYSKLDNNQTRDRIFKRELQLEECNNNKVFKFLNLLQPSNRQKKITTQLITSKE